ncbi:hypothetical protein WL32_28295 [Burkholderia cepacia]|uniref:hypothetical protein n=1 Tax=Burkholderia cepacia TaxID=292 RepID=UPI000754FBA7|nr:hypothetical protein [Burkholderia cepacia]KWB16514.1 hypothetical protein WL32_28295 [Burkholderia cepacia]
MNFKQIQVRSSFINDFTDDQRALILEAATGCTVSMPHDQLDQMKRAQIEAFDFLIGNGHFHELEAAVTDAAPKPTPAPAPVEESAEHAPEETE